MIWGDMSESNGLQGKVLLAFPRGFCAGVVRAIDIVNLALARFGLPLYVRREIVHNKYVVNELRQKGTIFIDHLEEVPPGNRVIFSAHGVSPEVRAEAQRRQLKVIDATCPLVTKVHLEAIKYAREGYTIILIGHADHDEVIGTLGEAPGSIRVLASAEEVDSLEVPDPDMVAYLTQTTLSLDDTRHIIERLRHRFPKIHGPSSEDICYATQNRQAAVLELAKKAEVILVVGSANSSNSRRLVEVAQSQGAPAYLIDDIESIRPGWLTGIRSVGLTAGASAPEGLVERVLRYLSAVGYPEVEIVGSISEDVEFALPPELARPERVPG
ncbi:MAG: 4-hydroxy-3-methylbut-2-enyl diphosphate reductase [Acidobacteriia bacterium]|nr:4-hydroxy-3-methylbut-2-enyl diphosphate reductase [Terriglobia bacterium]